MAISTQLHGGSYGQHEGGGGEGALATCPPTEYACPRGGEWAQFVERVAHWGWREESEGGEESVQFSRQSSVERCSYSHHRHPRTETIQNKLRQQK